MASVDNLRQLRPTRRLAAGEKPCERPCAPARYAQHRRAVWALLTDDLGDDPLSELDETQVFDHPAWQALRKVASNGRVDSVLDLYRVIAAAQDAAAWWHRERGMIAGMHPSKRWAENPGSGHRRGPALDHPHDLLIFRLGRAPFNLSVRGASEIVSSLLLWFLDEGSARDPEKRIPPDTLKRQFSRRIKADRERIAAEQARSESLRQNPRHGLDPRYFGPIIGED